MSCDFSILLLWVGSVKTHRRFIKIYELAKCHLQGYPDTLNSGLKMLSVAKVEKFTHQQKAEVLRLKAMMCGKLGRKDDAHKIFSQAIQCAMHIAKVCSEPVLA